MTLDWSGIVNDVVAGLLLSGILATIGLAIALLKHRKSVAQMLVNRALERLPDSARDTYGEEWHAEVHHASPRCALRFAFGIWLRVARVSATLDATASIRESVSSRPSRPPQIPRVFSLVVATVGGVEFRLNAPIVTIVIFAVMATYSRWTLPDWPILAVFLIGSVESVATTCYALIRRR